MTTFTVLANLYLKSVIYGLDNIPQIPKEIRFQLNFDYKKKGITYLQNMLKKLETCPIQMYI